MYISLTMPMLYEEAMKKIIWTCFLIVGVVSALLGSPFPADIDSLILRGIDLTYNSRFDSAMHCFQYLIDRYPDHPAGYFYQAATVQSKIMDYESEQWESEFYALSDKALAVGHARIDSNDQDPWVYYYTGSVYAYIGLYQAKRGKLIPGFKNAKKGVSLLEQSIKMDSTVYDACMGIGNYQYWSGKFYKYLKWLPWISDERKRGIALIERAMHLGKYSYWIGVNNLAWIEYDRGNFRRALALFGEGLARYPGSRFFLWGMADTYFKIKDYAHAIPLYEKIIGQIQNAPYNNGYNDVVCRFKLVRAYYWSENYEMAMRHCSAILNRKLDPEIADRLGDRREQANKYYIKARRIVKQKNHKLF